MFVWSIVTLIPRGLAGHGTITTCEPVSNLCITYIPISIQLLRHMATLGICYFANYFCCVILCT